MNYIKTTSGKITASIKGKVYVVNPDHVNYAVLKASAFKNDDEEFIKNYDVSEAFSVITDGKVTIKNDTVYYDGKPIHNSLSSRMLAMLEEGASQTGIQPWINFLKNLVQNPSKRAVNELYTFLENKDLPLTPDGHFLAYKRVKKTNETQNGKTVYVDCYSGTVKQKLGDVIKVERNSVDDDFGVECSEGLHVGSMSYVKNYCPNDQIFVVKINPKNVVSVPIHDDATKCRVCEYELYKVYDGIIDSVVAE